MSNVVVVGLGWGDEGKGKVTDLLGERADVVVRFGGGANAGHTLVVDGRKTVLHLIPSGVLHPHVMCVMGAGMAICPETLMEEIELCRGMGLMDDPERLVISRKAHLVLAYHKALDALQEREAGRLGTTLKGIGPCYEDRSARRGIPMEELLHPIRFKASLRRNLHRVNEILSRADQEPLNPDTLEERYLELGEQLLPFLKDASRVIHQKIVEGKRVLFEGAQGAMLDLFFGTYPYVTSSCTLAAGALTGSGLGPGAIKQVVGVTKAYTTRVGEGPFPTEDQGEVGKRIRDQGQEYGATTGRPRRCGWLDLAQLRLSIRLNGVTCLAMTKLDVLTGLSKIKICTGYQTREGLVDEMPTDMEELSHATPIYQEMEGWDADLRGARSLNDLPAEARRYLERVAEALSVPYSLVSVGSGRHETISVLDPFAK